MNNSEAMKLALEGLENHLRHHENGCVYLDPVVPALRQAIADAEQAQPVAWQDLLLEAQRIVESKPTWNRFIDGTPLANDIAGWMCDFAQQYAHSSQRTQLTDEQIGLLTTGDGWSHLETPALALFARAVERAHGIGGGE